MRYEFESVDTFERCFPPAQRSEWWALNTCSAKVLTLQGVGRTLGLPVPGRAEALRYRSVGFTGEGAKEEMR